MLTINRMNASGNGGYLNNKNLCHNSKETTLKASSITKSPSTYGSYTDKKTPSKPKGGLAANASSTRRPKKSVRFQPSDGDGEVHVGFVYVEHLDDLTEEEQAERWYTTAQMESMELQMKSDVYLLEQQEQQVAEVIEPRGLEHKTEEGSWRYYVHRKNSLNAVLDEIEQQQAQMQSYGSAKLSLTENIQWDRVSAVYAEACKAAYNEALERAQNDFQEIQQHIRELSQSHQSSSNQSNQTIGGHELEQKLATSVDNINKEVATSPQEPDQLESSSTKVKSDKTTNPKDATRTDKNVSQCYVENLRRGSITFTVTRKKKAKVNATENITSSPTVSSNTTPTASPTIKKLKKKTVDDSNHEAELRKCSTSVIENSLVKKTKKKLTVTPTATTSLHETGDHQTEKATILPSNSAKDSTCNEVRCAGTKVCKAKLTTTATAPSSSTPTEENHSLLNGQNKTIILSESREDESSGDTTNRMTTCTASSTTADAPLVSEDECRTPKSPSSKTVTPKTKRQSVVAKTKSMDLDPEVASPTLDASKHSPRDVMSTDDGETTTATLKKKKTPKMKISSSLLVTSSEDSEAGGSSLEEGIKTTKRKTIKRSNVRSKSPNKATKAETEKLDAEPMESTKMTGIRVQAHLCNLKGNNEFQAESSQHEIENSPKMIQSLSMQGMSSQEVDVSGSSSDEGLNSSRHIRNKYKVPTKKASKTVSKAPTKLADVQSPSTITTEASGKNLNHNFIDEDVNEALVLEKVNEKFSNSYLSSSSLVTSSEDTEASDDDSLILRITSHQGKTKNTTRKTKNETPSQTKVLKKTPIATTKKYNTKLSTSALPLAEQNKSSDNLSSEVVPSPKERNVKSSDDDNCSTISLQSIITVDFGTMYPKVIRRVKRTPTNDAGLLPKPELQPVPDQTLATSLSSSSSHEKKKVRATRQNSIAVTAMTSSTTDNDHSVNTPTTTTITKSRRKNDSTSTDIITQNDLKKECTAAPDVKSGSKLSSSRTSFSTKTASKDLNKSLYADDESDEENALKSKRTMARRTIKRTSTGILPPTSLEYSKCKHQQPEK